MCVGDFGERGDESRIEDVLVDYVGDKAEASYGGYGKHLRNDFCVLSAHTNLTFKVNSQVFEREEKYHKFVSVIVGLLLSPTLSLIGIHVLGAQATDTVPWQASMFHPLVL